MERLAINRFTLLVFLTATYMVSECNPLPVYGKGSLYGPEDFVYSLNGTTIKDEIFFSNRAWMVEFYSSWCGHCVNFAPKWKQFALDLKEWRSVVSVAGLDCADEINIPACREFEIMGYPTLKLFPPHAQRMVKDTDGNEAMNTGTVFQRPESMTKLKTNLMESLVPMYPTLLGSFNASTTKHLLEPNDYWKSSEFSSGPPFLVFLYESNGSHVGLEVALRLSRYQSQVRILRFHQKNPMYHHLGLNGWPAAGYISKDQASGSIILRKNQDLVDLLVKSTIGLAQISPISEVPEATHANYEHSNHVAGSEHLDSAVDTVNLEDLLHALRNALRNEVGLPLKLEGDKLFALKNFASIISQYFPTDRKDVKKFFISFSEWLQTQHEIENTIYLDKLGDLEEEFKPWDIDINAWHGCRGTIPGRRGYTCALWRLFHTLTVVGLQKNEDSNILPAINGYVKEFFGCEECSEHFSKMVARDSALEIRSIREQVLWLWKAHNEVNLRLKGTPSEDPEFPKTLYPTPEQCSSCYLGSKEFDTTKVEEYLVKVYSRPVRHLKSNGGGNEEQISSDDDVKHSNSGWLGGFFSLTDLGIFMIVYLSIALLLVFAYMHFKVASRRRRLIDPLRRLFTSPTRKFI